MASTPFSSYRPALAAVDATNAPLGLSPAKPTTDKAVPPTSLISLSSDNDELHTGHIGLHPAKDSSSHTYTITSQRSIAILLGRARNEHEESEIHPIATTEGQGMGSTPIRRVSLPSSAKHVSRDHAIIFHSPFGSAWAVKILGQNGLIVNGKRRRAGLILKLIPGQSILDFFGVMCLFMGSGGMVEEERSQVGNGSQTPSRLGGQSPKKRAVSALSRPSLGSEPCLSTASQLSSQLQKVITASPMKQRRLVANPFKRPLGAPPSPPTSSPAPFDLSSPVKQNAIRQRHLLNSSSPAQHQSEQDHDESSDEDYEEADRSASPSLSRRNAHHDDSGVMLEVDQTDSEDEASQAIRVESLKGKNDQTQAEEEEEEEDADSNSDGSELSPSPECASKRQEKRVKFTHPDSPKLTSSERDANNDITLRSSSLPSFQRIQRHLRAQVALLAETYDLQGLLAGAIVFHRTATISATEAVRSVLSSNPGLLRGEVGPEGIAPSGTERGMCLAGWTFEDIIQSSLITGDEVDKEKVEVWQRKAWREKLEECLLEGECFGIISRAGKDASGNPLECWYYYDKDGDPDSERAANLGALAKPMRAALKTHKPIFWKKSAYGHSSENNNNQSKWEGQAMASESQWGSSGSALDSMMFTSRNSTPKVEDDEKIGLTPSSSSSCWEETQYEEREKTWDRQGDNDFEMRAKKVRRRK